MWQRAEKALFKVEEFVIGLSMAVIMIAILVQIVARILGFQSLGMPEYAAIGMTIITFVGASAITYTRDYISIELGQLFKSPKIPIIMNVLVDILIIVFAVLFFNIMYAFFQFVVESGEKTLEVGIPVSISYGIICISIILMAIHSISNIVKGILSLRKGGVV